MEQMKDLKLGDGKSIDEQMVVKILNLNKETQDELEKIEQFNFNVFTVRE